MAPKKRKDEGEVGSDKKKRKPSTTAAPNGVGALTPAASFVEERQMKAVLEGDKFSGELLICGGTNWDLTGRKQLPKGAKNVGGRNVWSAHRIESFKGVAVRTVVSGCMACHSVVITTDGKAYSWGRNDTGQLGHGDTERRDVPTLIESLTDFNIVNAACGKGHTLFLTDRGTVFAVGCNVNAQLGLGTISPAVLSPCRVQYKGPPIQKLCASGEFSVMADMVGNVYTFGSPEYGQLVIDLTWPKPREREYDATEPLCQECVSYLHWSFCNRQTLTCDCFRLGHNTDGQYFVSNSKIGFAPETRPRRVMVFIEKARDGQVTPITDVEARDVACGQNHIVVLDRKDRVFTWGFGGYGRLGHDENKDEWVPRLVKFFDGPGRGVASIAVGSTFTTAVNQLGVMYLWGQTKSTGEAAMYPKPIHDLSGWKVRHVACCYKSIVVLADNSTISWGCSPTYGELGYGPTDVKSSSTPQVMKPLEDMHIHTIACGWGHTLFIARNDTEEDLAKVEALPVYVP